MSDYFLYSDADEGVRLVVVPVTYAHQNCSIIWCGETRRAAVIDPGGDLDQIKLVVEAEGIELEQILVTHGHHDHCGAAADLSDELGLPIIGPHEGDRYWIDVLNTQPQKRRVLHNVRSFTPTRWLKDGDHISIGQQTLEAIHCPGHTPGSIVYFDPRARLAFVGDVLFKNHVGATQLPYGDHIQLMRSILGKLWPLGDDVAFVPGHGPMSTFGEERRSNPYVSDQAIAPYYDRLMRAPPS